MNNRPTDPRTARNKNVLIIGGSGSGKTRFWIKPNLMQCTSRKYPVSFVVTDPKGSIVTECGKMLLHYGYRLKILNTINFKKSMHYNPFAYIHSEKDILKLVTALIANTKGEGKAGDDFWVKAETLLYTALIGYIHYEAPEEEQNFSTLVEMVNTMEVREDDEEFQNQVDLMFADLEKENPEHFAVRQYKKYKLAAGVVCSKRLLNQAVEKSLRTHNLKSKKGAQAMRKNEKITALYERLSRDDFGKDDDQQRESNSISNQKAMLEEFAARQGFKDKKSHYVPEDEWTIFENTHEAIIDQQTFDLVQKIRGNVRRYPDGWGEAAPLTGLLYCADCGGKMYVHRTNNGKRISQYTCSQYSKVPVGKLCTTQHRINEDVVLSLVSEMLKAIAEYAKHDRAEFVRVVQEAQSSQQTAEVKKQRTRLATAKQRVSELEVLLCKIYEDNILGKLSDSRYATLDAQYEKEQTELTAEISVLEKAIKSYEKHEKDADRFIALIDKYENFDKLTIAMLNEFIEKILVHERDRKGSIQTTQEVEIYFNFVGRFVPPAFGEVELTPEELEEIRKREERKDRLHQNYLKRKANGKQKEYEERTKAKKKAEIEARKQAIRTEDIARGVFIPVSSLPQLGPRKGA